MLTLLFRRPRRYGGAVGLVALLAMGLAAAALGQTVSISGALPRPRYLREHCSIEVPVNVGGGRGTHVKDGVSVHGKNTEAMVEGRPEQFARIYRWQISKQDRFCGIVGIWEGEGPEGETTLQPTSETALGGEYLDTTASMNPDDLMPPRNAGGIAEFIVFARPATG